MHSSIFSREDACCFWGSGVFGYGRCDVVHVESERRRDAHIEERWPTHSLFDICTNTVCTRYFFCECFAIERWKS